MKAWQPALADAVAPIGGEPAQVVLAGGTAQVLAGLDEPWTLLSDSERNRARKFRYDTHRNDFVAAHVLARACVAALASCPIGSVRIAQRCDECGGDHGQPYVVGERGLHLSWSHGHGYVAAAAAAAPVSVDVEVVDGRRFDDALLATVLTAEDAAAVRAADRPDVAFLRQWVRKECLIKLGLATLDTVRQVSLATLPLRPDGPVRWRPWGEGRRVLDWRDQQRQAVGSAVLLAPPAR